MANHEFTLEKMSLANGGMLAASFDQLVERCIADCDDRPNHNKPRTVTLTMSFVPISPLQKGADLDSVDGTAVVSCSLPKTELPKINFAYRKRRGPDGKARATIVFNDLSEDDHRQRTMDELSE